MDRRTFHFVFLLFSLTVVLPSAVAQKVIATIPVGTNPGGVGVNPVTNKIYVANGLCNENNSCGQGTVTVIDGASNSTTTMNIGVGPGIPVVNSATNKIYVANGCGNTLPCGTSTGTVTVIDGATNNTATVTVGWYAGFIAVNPVTNKIYVTNNCGKDPNCASAGTLTVIDGATNATSTIDVQGNPFDVEVNPVTNQVYVVNNCGIDPNCATTGTVTVIDGATNTITATLNVGAGPYFAAVNPVTNKIYVANSSCSLKQLPCSNPGSVTVIDGATNATTTLSLVDFAPFGIAVDAVTNKIYVVDTCGADPNCAGSGTVTVIDGVTNNSVPVNVGTYPFLLAIDAVTNSIYVVNAFCNKLEKHVGLTCSNGPGTVTAIDGATNKTVSLGIGGGPFDAAVNATTNRIYVPNVGDGTTSVIAGANATALQFVAVTPCRLVDTRKSGGPIQGNTSRDFTIPQLGGCNIPTTAAAYSLNVTVVPPAPLGYLTIWPTGEDRPVVSTMNSLDGRIKANAAIVPAGASGAVSVYVSNTTDVVLDIDGYFAPTSGSTLAFYSLAPCRVADTRKSNFPQGLGVPQLSGTVARDFPVLESSCIPMGITPAAYSFNFTAVPYPALGDPLGYLEVWPTGQKPQNPVSTLNNLTGTIVANAAIVPAGTGGEITAYASNDTDLVIDINGYFAPAGQNGLSLYPAAPCRVIDTRKIGNGQPFSGTLSPPVDVVDSVCGPPSTALAYVFNATVVPSGGLGYLTLWPDGQTQPVVSTLNAIDGAITSNMAIVPTNNGEVDAYASGITQLILDISSYFAP